MRRLKRLICLLRGHRYWIRQVFSATRRRVGCRRCGGDWGMHDGVRAFVQWDGDLAELYKGRNVTVNMNVLGLDVGYANWLARNHWRSLP